MTGRHIQAVNKADVGILGNCTCKEIVEFIKDGTF